MNAAPPLALGPTVDPASGDLRFVVGPATLGRRPDRVWFHLRDFGADPAFYASSGCWQATIPRPPVDRLEYQFIVRAPDGSEVMVLDPSNQRRAVGVFGDQSLIELPGYRAPQWLGAASTPWSPKPLTIDTDVPGVVVTGVLLNPPDVEWDRPLPLLLVHDGMEYSRLARLGDYLRWLAQRRPELTCRVLLLHPQDRDRSYSANEVYTAALVEQALPAARALAPTVGLVCGLGASLGALALVHAAASYPGTFSGLMCQSGSFFLPQYDAQERRFPYYEAVLKAVSRLQADPSPLVDMPITITVGLGEENLENNRAMAEMLRANAGRVELVEGRDGHNFTAWRDLWDPALEGLIGEATSV